MNKLMKVMTLGAVLAATAPLALASSFTIESYGTDLNNGTANTTPVGIGNTAMAFNAAGSDDPTHTLSTTYDIPTVLPWANLTALSASSSWVSYDPGTWVGGPYVAPSGNYIYHTTFTASAGATGSITVLADDTTSVVLNGHQVVGQAAANAATNCTQGTPNCILAETYTFDASDFVVGTNNLKFVVAQDFGSATGVEFVGTINSPINSNNAATPEPSSLILLGTGLVSAAGTVLRRRKLIA